MELQIHASYIGLVRNVIDCGEEPVRAVRDITIGSLLHLVAAKPAGDFFQQTVFRNGPEPGWTAHLCINECDPKEFASVSGTAKIFFSRSSPLEGDQAMRTAFDTDRVSRTVSLTPIRGVVDY